MDNSKIQDKAREANEKADELIIRAAYKNAQGIKFKHPTYNPEELGE